MVRCRWADPNSEIYLAYHDREWAVRSMMTENSLRC